MCLQRRDDDSVRRDRDGERERDEDVRRKVGIARLRIMAEGTGKGIIVGMVAAEMVCWHFKNWECFSALALRHAIL